MSTPDPVQAIHVAVNRWAYGEDGRAGSEPFLPEQALDPRARRSPPTPAARRSPTTSTSTGRLAPGMLADLAVLDRDPFAGDPAEIGAARVRATYVDGEAVYEAVTRAGAADVG